MKKRNMLSVAAAAFVGMSAFAGNSWESAYVNEEGDSALDTDSATITLSSSSVTVSCYTYAIANNFNTAGYPADMNIHGFSQAYDFTNKRSFGSESFIGVDRRFDFNESNTVSTTWTGLTVSKIFTKATAEIQYDSMTGGDVEGTAYGRVSTSW
ncbi:hypothetical protein MLD52_17855 [Puniceicoccaceae bacterium K14]|nr:hypothetical protein [Puniceicoccaceae bacterium K14]